MFLGSPSRTSIRSAIFAGSRHVSDWKHQSQYLRNSTCTNKKTDAPQRLSHKHIHGQITVHAMTDCSLLTVRDSKSTMISHAVHAMQYKTSTKVTHYIGSTHSNWSYSMLSVSTIANYNTFQEPQLTWQRSIIVRIVQIYQYPISLHWFDCTAVL